MDPGKLMDLHAAAAISEARRRRLVEAGQLMRRMEQKYRATQGNERRLLVAYSELRKILAAIEQHWAFRLLPRRIREEIIGELFG